VVSPQAAAEAKAAAAPAAKGKAAMSRFFIERPIFASVIAIIITLAGLVAFQVLPAAQYPEIAPPTVTITAALPGSERGDALAHRWQRRSRNSSPASRACSTFSPRPPRTATLTITCIFRGGDRRQQRHDPGEHRVADRAAAAAR